MAEYIVDTTEGILHARTTGELVRCRDCKHATDDGYGCDFFSHCEQDASYRWEEVPAEVEPNGFCKWSVRREEDE